MYYDSNRPINIKEDSIWNGAAIGAAAAVAPVALAHGGAKVAKMMMNRGSSGGTRIPLVGGTVGGVAKGAAKGAFDATDLGKSLKMAKGLGKVGAYAGSALFGGFMGAGMDSMISNYKSQ